MVYDGKRVLIRSELTRKSFLDIIIVLKKDFYFFALILLKCIWIVSRLRQKDAFNTVDTTQNSN